MPEKSVRDVASDVDQFSRLAMTIVEAAGHYAEGGVYDPEADSMIRRLRVVCNAVTAALANVPVSMTQAPIAPVMMMQSPATTKDK